MFHFWRAAAAVALACSSALASADDAAEDAALGGTLLAPVPYAATVVVVPARTAAPYASLAEALHERGFGSLVLDPAKKHDLAAIAASVATASEATASPCIWLLGHGEGAPAALAAAQQAEHLCGVILVAASGKAKKARLAASLSVPLLVVSGGKDVEAGAAVGAALRSVQPAARHAVVLEMDHALRGADQFTASTAISSRLVDVISSFMLEKGPQVHGSLEPRQTGSSGSRRAALDLRARTARS